MSSNANVERHLARAASHIAKGEEYYGKAADDIRAAMRADPQLSQQAIADRVGKSKKWVWALVQWRTNGDAPPTPFSREAGETERRNEQTARNVIRDSPQVIAEMVEELHDEPAFQAAVASANSRIDAKREQRTSEREQVERGLSEQEAEFERLRKDMRAGNYGDAERRLQKTEMDELVAAYMRQQGDRFKYLMDWAYAWADAKPIKDEQLQEWLS